MEVLSAEDFFDLILELLLAGLLDFHLELFEIKGDAKQFWILPRFVLALSVHFFGAAIFLDYLNRGRPLRLGCLYVDPSSRNTSCVVSNELLIVDIGSIPHRSS